MCERVFMTSAFSLICTKIIAHVQGDKQSVFVVEKLVIFFAQDETFFTCTITSLPQFLAPCTANMPVGVLLVTAAATPQQLTLLPV